MQYRKKIIKNILVAAGVAGLVISISPLSARLLQNESSHQLSSHHHSEKNRFTKIGGDWPPQPKNMENIVWLQDDNASRLKSRSDTDDLAASLSADDVSELGRRFTFIGTKSSVEKDATLSQQTMTFFSHSNNMTVDVKVSQGDVNDVEQITPSKYQPPLSAEEVKSAVNIARESFENEGFSQVKQLKGYGILAFKSSSDLTSENGGFYDTRVAYVSFHAHIDARPEFVAWVDLTEETIIKSREDKL